MQILYTLILYLIAPFVLLRLFWLSRRNPAYRQRWQERFGFYSQLQFLKPVVWIHAVSVGEVQATRPLVKELVSTYPHIDILMTTVTPTGAVTVEQSYGDTLRHVYFPYDLPFAIKRFLSVVKPQLLIVMETELWPNLLRQCRLQNIPVLLVNGRLSQRSCRAYQRIASLTRKTVNNIDVIATQSQLDAERFIRLGANSENVQVAGNLKFDIKLPHSVAEQAQSLRRFFSVDRPVWIAASTHEGEERLVLRAFKELLRTQKDCLLILVPRHPERFQEVVELSNRLGLHTSQRTNPDNYTAYTQVFVLDTLGELPMFYACSDVAFVGGSLVPAVGGHNMLEPASLALPVISGEYIFNFVEVGELLSEERALIFVSNPDELAEEVAKLLCDANLRHEFGERARQVVVQNQGATERVMQLIHSRL